MNASHPSLEGNYKFCTSCGHSNPPWSKKCERCNADLMELPEMIGASSRKRPGCVTAYVILIAIGAVISILAGIVLLIRRPMLSQYMEQILSSPALDTGQGVDITYLSQILNIAIPVTLAISFVTAAFDLFIAWGLWRLKNWARILVIVLQGLGLLGYVYSLVSALFAPSPAASEIEVASSYGAICVSLLSLGIGGSIVFWFATNGKYFS